MFQNLVHQYVYCVAMHKTRFKLTISQTKKNDYCLNAHHNNEIGTEFNKLERSLNCLQPVQILNHRFKSSWIQDLNRR